MAKEVRIERQANTKFKVSHGNKSGDNEAAYPELDFPKDSGPQLIVFKIDSPKEVFDPTKPIWVSSASKPKQDRSSDQIIDATVMPGGKTLVVLNTNTKAGKLYYNLNMKSEDGPVRLDPVITNGGGTGTGTGTVTWSSALFANAQATALTIAAAVALVLLGALIGRVVWKTR